MQKQIDSNLLEYRNRATQDLLLVAISIVLLYLFSYAVGFYNWVYYWLDFFENRWLNELFITLIFSIIPFSVFAWRRFADINYEISKREKLDVEFKNYRNQTHKIFESLNDLVFQVDKNLRIVWANSASLQVQEQLIGEQATKLLYPQEENLPADSYLLKSIERENIETEIRYYPADEVNNERYLEHLAIPFKDIKGEVVAITSISRDITERMQLEESKSRLASIIESSDDAIFVVSLDGSIHSWNLSAEKIFGYKTEQVVGQPITILDHIIDFETLIRIPYLNNPNFSGERIQHVDMVAVKRSDKTLFVSLTVYPFVDETGKVLGFSTIARDISASIEAEEALRESESRFRQLADSIQDAFWLIDWEKKKYLFISPAYKKIWGKEPATDKFDVYEWATDIHQDDRQRLIDATLNIVENNGLVEEFRVIDPISGNIRWIRDRGFPVYNNKGEVYRVAGIAQDITENKLAEEALKESETRFKELFQNMSSGVAVYEAINNGDDFIIKDFNKAGEKIENVVKSDILGVNLKSIFEDVRNYKLIEQLKIVYQTAIPKSYLFTFYEKGEIRGWRQNYFYKLPSGEVVSIFDDVTEKIKQDEALRESEERYRTFVTNFKGIAFRWTPNYEPIFMHGNVEAITGYLEQEFISNSVSWDSIIQHSDFPIRLEKKELIRSEPNLSSEFEYRIIRKDGSIVWVNESLHNIIDNNNNITYVQSTIYDITQRKQAEEALIASRQQLRNLALHLDSVREEERKQIAFEIHDELGYILTAMKIDLAWLVKRIDLTKDNLEVRTKEMSNLIELTIQKVRTISYQLRPSILDHFGLVATIDEQSKEFQRRTAIRTRFNVEPKDLIVLEPIATPMFRIFQESLTNISRYAKASRVDVSLIKNEHNLILRVADNGIGIKHDRLFANDSFGLLGMREKAKSMGGEIVIRNMQLSKEEGGTEVILTIPFDNN